MPDLGQLVTGTALAFSGAVLSSGLMYLYGIVIARFLGAEEVGLFFLALVTMQIISAVCRVGLPEGLLRFVSIYMGKGDSPRVKGTILSAVLIVVVTTVLVGGLLFVFAKPLSPNKTAR